MTIEQFVSYHQQKIPNSDINKKYYCSFLEHVSSHCSYNNCRCVFPVIRRMYNSIFANEPLDSITTGSVYQKLQQNRQFTYWAIRFLFFLIDNADNMHPDVLEMEKFRDYLLAAQWNDAKLLFLKTENKNKFIIRHAKNKNQLCLIDIDDAELLNITKEFVNHNLGTADTTEYKVFLAEFTRSCPTPPTLDTLNYDTCLHQIEYFKKYESSDYIYLLNAFYYFIGLRYKPDIFADKGIQLINLQKMGFATLLANGYEPFIHNPMDKVPTSDKWILIHNNRNVSNTNTSRSGSLDVNFSDIKNKTYRNWAKAYIWQNRITGHPSSGVSILTHCLNYISSLKDGTELSIFTKPTKDLNITTNEVLACRNYIYELNISYASKATYLSTFRQFLRFLKENNITDIPVAAEYTLSKAMSGYETNTAKKIPDEHLAQLAALMKKNAENSVLHELYHLIFYIALETEFRSSQIFTLKTNCVQETNKPNEYVLISKTKTSNNETMEQPITIYVKKHIDRILQLTLDNRQKCTISELRDYLLLEPPKPRKTQAFQVIDWRQFNRYLTKCCDELNITRYTMSNLRDTHMTKAEEFVIRNQMSDMQQNVLSGHKSPTTDTKHYVDTDIKELLESVHGILIGDVDINGQIITTNSDVTRPENAVSNNCGYCNSAVCNNHSMLDCMMCKSFVTTIDRLPYFQEQIKVLDHKIQNASIAHDKEDLVNIKRLHLGFINEILKLKGGTIDVE